MYQPVPRAVSIPFHFCFIPLPQDVLNVNTIYIIVILGTNTGGSASGPRATSSCRGRQMRREGSIGFGSDVKVVGEYVPMEKCTSFRERLPSER